jgi:hypothetical protein
MRRVLSPIFEWIRRAGWHVQSRLVLRLVTIAAFDREDAVPVSAAPQADGFVGPTVLTLQRRIACRLTIDAPRVTEHFERFDECRPRIRIIA